MVTKGVTSAPTQEHGQTRSAVIPIPGEPRAQPAPPTQTLVQTAEGPYFLLIATARSSSPTALDDQVTLNIARPKERRARTLAFVNVNNSAYKEFCLILCHPAQSSTLLALRAMPGQAPRSLSDLGRFYCADGIAVQISAIFRCIAPLCASISQKFDLTLPLGSLRTPKSDRLLEPVHS